MLIHLVSPPKKTCSLWEKKFNLIKLAFFFLYCRCRFQFIDVKGWHVCLEVFFGVLISSITSHHCSTVLNKGITFFQFLIILHNMLSFWIFKASALWADAFYKLICPSVCWCVCPSVCSLLRYLLNVFFAPTSRSRMSNIFRDSESLGKSNVKMWSHIWAFLFESCLQSPRKQKLFFLLILPYKTWWKPRFPMD